MFDLTRKQFLTGLAAGVVGAIPSTRFAAAAEADTVIVAAADTPQTLDADRANQLESWDGGHNLNESLFGYKFEPPIDGVSAWDISKMQQVTPLLAEDYSQSVDGKETTIKLRKGVVSAAGNRLSTKDIDFLFKVLTAKGSGARPFVPVVGNFDPLTGVEIKDDLTFVIKSTQPSPLLLPVLTLWLANVPDAAAIQPHITADDPTASSFMSKNGSGYGPYVLEELRQGQQAVYRAFPDYWGDAPKAKRIISRAVPDSANRFALLQQGAVQIAAGLRPREINLVPKKASFGGNQLLWMAFNCTLAPFDNADVRRALSYATPYEAILATVYQGTAQRAWGPMPDTYPNNIGRKSNPYGYDIAKARQLLAKAGHSALDIEISYSTTTPNIDQIVLLIQAAWRQVGVNVKLLKLDSSTYGTRKFKGDLQAWIDFDQANVPDMGYVSALFFATKGFANYGKYSNTAVDEATVKMNGTLNPEERDEYGRRIQKIVIDEAPWIPLVQPGAHWGLGGTVSSVGWETDNGLVYKMIA